MQGQVKDSLLGGSFERIHNTKSRFIFTKERRTIRLKSGCLNNSNELNELDGGFMFERIHNTKEQIYIYERAENDKAKERMFK